LQCPVVGRNYKVSFRAAKTFSKGLARATGYWRSYSQLQKVAKLTPSIEANSICDFFNFKRICLMLKAGTSNWRLNGNSPLIPLRFPLPGKHQRTFRMPPQPGLTEISSIDHLAGSPAVFE